MTIFPPVILLGNNFKKNNRTRWKVDSLKQHQSKTSRNKRNKASLTTPKFIPNPKMVILYICWEPLLKNETINSDKYCLKWHRLKTAFSDLEERVIFPRNNGKHIMSLETRQKFVEFLLGCPVNNLEMKYSYVS